MRKAYYFKSGSIYTRTLSSLTDKIKDWVAIEIQDEILTAMVNEYDNAVIQANLAKVHWNTVRANFDEYNATQEQIDEYINALEESNRLAKIEWEKYDKMLNRYDETILNYHLK